MRTKKSLHQEAKKLVQLSLDASKRVSEERVRVILATLKERHTPLALRHLLKAYVYFLSKEIQKSTGLLEHAGDLVEAQLQSLVAHLGRVASRPVELLPRREPGLIAGIRVSLGDYVWEDTVASRLDRLRQSF